MKRGGGTKEGREGGNHVSRHACEKLDSSPVLCCKSSHFWLSLSDVPETERHNPITTVYSSIFEVL